jgi:colanic acid biosynthesis glycosyl transferase WcaI
MRKTRRVIFLNRFFYPDLSSTSQLLSDLTHDLARAGAGVAVITSRLKYDDPQARLPRREQVHGVDVYRVFSSAFGRRNLLGRAADLASFYIAAFAQLLTLAGRGDLIIAKTDPPLLSILVHAAGVMKGARFMNWLQDIYPEVASALGVRGLSGMAGRSLIAWRNASLRAAQVNVVLGQRMARHLRDAGISPDRIRIIPNWSDEQAITPMHHAANPLRVSWGLKGKFVVGYSGNLGRAHEWETMLGAARTLKNDPTIAFLMIGDGHHMAALRAAAERERLTNILFQPYQPTEALAASLSAADVHWISLNAELEGLVFPS